MQPVKQLPHLQLYSPLAAQSPTFKLFTAYENSAALVQARKVQDQLALLCKDEFEFITHSLKFSLFRREDSWQGAVAQAASADMIIISVSEAAKLPIPVQSWIKAWPRRKQVSQAALVMVFDLERSKEEHQLLASSCRQIAEDRGFDFFCNREIGGYTPSLFQKPHYQSNLGYRSNITTYHPPMENWGIND